MTSSPEHEHAEPAGHPGLPTVPDPRAPARLTERVREFVAGVDEAIPGLLDAVHLTGSGASGDWQHDSDIDLVFETSRPVGAADTAALLRLHASTATGHCVDGIYLTSAQLAAGPDAVASAPQVVSAEFELDKPGGQLTWVTWLEMRLGPTARVASGRLEPWTAGWASLDPASSLSRRAMEASRDNLRSYWLPYAGNTTERLAGRPDDDAVPAEAIEWLALGAQRLVVTMETAAIVSKSEAARFAARRWPEYAELLTRVLASRRGETRQFTVRDAHLSVALVLACVALAE